MAKKASKALKRLRGKKNIKSSGRKIVSLNASKKAYSLYEKKHGGVPEIENAPHGSKGKATIRWHQNRQDAKMVARLEKMKSGLSKRSQAKSIKGGKQLKEDYIKNQDARIAAADKIISKRQGNNTRDASVRERMENIKYNATLAKKSAMKSDIFDGLTSQEVRAMKSIMKKNKTLSPQQLRDGAVEGIKLNKKLDNKYLLEKAVISGKITPREANKYQKDLAIINERAAFFNKKVGNKVYTTDLKKVAKSAKSRAQYVRHITTLDSKLVAFEKKVGIKRDPPKLDVGNRKVSVAKPRGSSSQITKVVRGTSSSDAGASKSLQTGGKYHGNAATRLRNKQAREVIDNDRGEIVQGKAIYGFTGHKRKTKADIKRKIKRRKN